MKKTDQEIVDELVARNKAAKDAAEAEPEPEPYRPPNRAERRLMVANLKRMLADGPKQVPVRNPTIIPRAVRRRQKRHRGRA